MATVKGSSQKEAKIGKVIITILDEDEKGKIGVKAEFKPPFDPENGGTPTPAQAIALDLLELFQQRLDDREAERAGA